MYFVFAEKFLRNFVLKENTVVALKSVSVPYSTFALTGIRTFFFHYDYKDLVSVFTNPKCTKRQKKAFTFSTFGEICHLSSSIVPVINISLIQFRLPQYNCTDTLFSHDNNGVYYTDVYITILHVSINLLLTNSKAVLVLDNFSHILTQ